jgi:Leucine-rich repeat (LRR) protein
MIVTDLHLLQCQSRPLSAVPRDELLCHYSRHCSSDCACCDFEACDCHSVCPNDCSCLHDRAWHRHLVHCPHANLTAIHLLLPQTITELDYSNNRIDEIQPFLFVGKSSLQSLRLSNNQLKSINNETFCAATQLQQLDLSGNPSIVISLTTLDHLFRCLLHLKDLIISEDQIDQHQSLDPGWILLSNNVHDRTIRLTRLVKTSTGQSGYH